MFACLSNLFNKFLPHLAAYNARRRESQYAAREARRHRVRYFRPCLEGLEERVVPAVDEFIALSGAWTTAANWSTGALPGAMDTAYIPDGHTCVLNGTPGQQSGQTVAGLTLDGNLTLAAGQLSVTTATLNSGSSFTLSPGAILAVLSSADFLGGATISGQIDAQGGTVSFNPGSSTVLASGANLTGSLFNIFGYVYVTGAISQQATMVLDDNNATTAGELVGPGSLIDSGEFDWNGGGLGLSGGMDFLATADLQIQSNERKSLTAGTLTNQCNSSAIGGTGVMFVSAGATFDNLGNPTCDVTIPTIDVLGTGAFINDVNGFFDEQGTTTIVGNFTNNGILTVGAGAALTLSSSGGTLLDGTLFLDGTLTLLGSVASPTGFNLASGSGTLQVGELGTAATLTIGSGYEALLTGGTLEVTSGSTLTGGELNNSSGVLQLDLGSSTAGLASFLQSPSGQLTLQASSLGYSSLIVTGDASLAGTLNLDLAYEYTPPAGTVLTVVTAGAIDNEFNVTPPDMTVDYGPTTVTLTQN